MFLQTLVGSVFRQVAGSTAIALCRRTGLAEILDELFAFGQLLLSVRHVGRVFVCQVLTYAIVKPGDFPPEIDQILRRKKESAFQMAYESGDDLYILRGYGKQKSGGFSIQIEEVSKSENAVFVRTKLVGPAAKEEQKGAASCPYVVLKTKAAAGISVVFED